MAEVFAGAVQDFDEHNRRVVSASGHEVVVIRVNKDYRAFSNTCLHMGGPVGEGVVMPKVEAMVDSRRRVTGETFSAEKLHLVCPWHGWEYDLDTGEAVGMRSLKLRQYETALRGDDVYVVVPDA